MSSLGGHLWEFILDRKFCLISTRCLYSCDLSTLRKTLVHVLPIGKFLSLVLSKNMMLQHYHPIFVELSVHWSLTGG